MGLGSRCIVSSRKRDAGGRRAGPLTPDVEENGSLGEEGERVNIVN